MSLIRSCDVAVMNITWRWCHFHELSVHELLQLLMARQEVFIVEQQCIYPDADAVDAQSHHLAAWSPDGLVACARVVAPGVKYAEPSIGRVLTTAAARGTGLGRELVRRAVTHAEATYPGLGIRISAQAHLCPFYAEAGFVGVGSTYLEDGIPHQEMVRHVVRSNSPHRP